MKFRINPSSSECEKCKLTYGETNTPCLMCGVEVHEVLKLENDRVYYIKDHKIKKAHIDYITLVDD